LHRIACIYSGILKLSLLTKRISAYRGVNEEERLLPDSFLNADAGQFAGGVEPSFMSTTTSAKVAAHYCGKGHGSIFVINFSMTSRGASLKVLSQFPHEEELLFPPLTAMQCKGYSTRGNKRLVHVDVSVSTMRPDTSGIPDPDSVPAGPRRVQVRLVHPRASTRVVMALAASLVAAALAFSLARRR
jgi:hypothetical protein